MKLGKLFGAAVGVLTIPVAVVKDVVTLGGIATAKGESYTKEKLYEIEEKLDEVSE